MVLSKLRAAGRPRAIAAWLFCLIAAPGAMGGALVLAPLQAVAAFLCAPWRSLPRLARKGGLPLALFAAFIAWSILSALWSPERGGRTATHLLMSVAAGLAFVAGMGFQPAAPESRWVRRAMIAFFVLTLGLGLIEIFAGMPLNRLAQPDQNYYRLLRAPMKGVTVLTVTCWAGAALLWRQGTTGKAAAGALLAGALLLGLNSTMDANVLAFSFGLLGFAGGLATPGLAFRIAAIATSFWLFTSPLWLALAAPALAGLSLPASWVQRLAVWRAATDGIADHLLFGQGLGAFRVTAGAVRTGAASIEPLHAHSASVQIWYETGLIGVGLAAAALGLWGWRWGGALKDRASAAAATGCLLACACVASLSFSAWMEWWVATMFAAAAFAAAVQRA